MLRILFLCHGNICRSTMAEFVMKDKLARAGLDGLVHVESAALHRDELGSDTHRGTARILDQHGIAHPPRAAHLTKRSDYDHFDYIVGMDRYNMADMRRLYGRRSHGDGDLGKLSLLMDWTGENRDVADPWYTHDFETTYCDVDAGCDALMEEVRKRLSGGRRS